MGITAACFLFQFLSIFFFDEEIFERKPLSPVTVRNEDSGYLSDHDVSRNTPFGSNITVADPDVNCPSKRRHSKLHSSCPGVKRRLFECDLRNNNDPSVIEESKRLKIDDEEMSIEAEITHLTQLKAAIDAAKLRGKNRSPGSPRDTVSFRALRPKIHSLNKRLQLTLTLLYNNGRAGDCLELCCAIWSLIKRIPTNWEDDGHSEFALIPTKTTATFIHLVIRDKMKNWSPKEIDHQLKRLNLLDNSGGQLSQTQSLLQFSLDEP